MHILEANFYMNSLWLRSYNLGEIVSTLYRYFDQ